MAKFNRLYALVAAGICALAISCTAPAPQPGNAPDAPAQQPSEAPAAPAGKAPEAPAKPGDDGKKAEGPAEPGKEGNPAGQNAEAPAPPQPDRQNQAPEDPSEINPVETPIRFIESFESKNSDLVRFLDSATKEQFADKWIKAKKLSAKDKAQVLEQLKDQNSDVSKFAAGEICQNAGMAQKFKGFQPNEFRPKAKVTVKGSKARAVYNDLVFDLVKESDGWKLAPETFR